MPAIRVQARCLERFAAMGRSYSDCTGSQPPGWEPGLGSSASRAQGLRRVAVSGSWSFQDRVPKQRLSRTSSGV